MDFLGDRRAYMHVAPTHKMEVALLLHSFRLFYFCFSSSGGYEKINAREESNSVVLSIAACRS